MCMSQARHRLSVPRDTYLPQPALPLEVQLRVSSRARHRRRSRHHPHHLKLCPSSNQTPSRPHPGSTSKPRDLGRTGRRPGIGLDRTRDASSSHSRRVGRTSGRPGEEEGRGGTVTVYPRSVFSATLLGPCARRVGQYGHLADLCKDRSVQKPQDRRLSGPST